MKILVTGGSGYIGSQLVPYLISKGHQVRVIDKADFGINLDLNLSELEYLQLDLFQTQQQHFQDIDVVVHLSGLSNDPMADFNPSDNFIQNLSGTAITAWNARRAGVRKFICAGSCSVYGMTHRGILDESVIPESDFPYAVSKMQAEDSLKYLGNHNFEITTLRQATVFGWAPRMRTDLVVNTMTKNAVLKRKISVTNTELSRPLIHVKDLCEVYLRLIETARPLPRVINVATGNYTLMEIAESVKSALSGIMPDIEIENLDLPDPRSYQVSTDLLKQTIGQWNPITIKQAVEELVEHISVNDHAMWSDPQWTNIAVYKARIEKEQSCKKS